MDKNNAESFRTFHLVDPELRPLAEGLAALKVSDESLQATRDFVDSISVLEDAVPKCVTRSEIDIPLRDGTALRALLYQRSDKIRSGKKNQTNAPALMHIHGGGLIMGKPDINDQRHLQLCETYGLTILAPTYRFAPEHPYPAALDDCLDAWDWLYENAAQLGLDTSKMALSGDSAGGGLAASMSQYLRDQDGPKHSGGAIAHLMLIYPMLDARTGQNPSALDPLVGEFGWTAEMNRYGWDAYLAGSKPAAPASPFAAKTLKGLPPCWIGVGSLDLFLDENIKYARRLISAGVPTELKIYPGAIHGFPLFHRAAISQSFLRDYAGSLELALRLPRE